MTTSSNALAAAQDFSSLNHELGEDRATLAYFDKLPPESPKRAGIGEYIFDLLLSDQRYTDAIKAQPYAEYKVHLGNFKSALGQTPAVEAASLREYIVTEAGKELEALAGAGKLDDARDLLKTALEFDHSATTIGTLNEHLRRAGHADLMPKSAGGAT
jgi:hypothetical protein